MPPLLLYGLGIRLSEAATLKDSDLDLEEATAKVLGKEAKAYRPIPKGCIPPGALSTKRPEGAEDIFLIGLTRRESQRTIARIVDEAARALGQHVSPTNFATALLPSSRWGPTCEKFRHFLDTVIYQQLSATESDR